jgi:translation initiation factor IF-1
MQDHTTRRTRFITTPRRLSALLAAFAISAPLAAVQFDQPALAKSKKDQKSKGNKDGGFVGAYRGTHTGNHGGSYRTQDRDPSYTDVDDDRDDYDGRDSDGDGRDYDYDEDDNGRGRDRVRRTLEGVVTRDLPGNRFEMRSDNGRVVTVRARAGEAARLSRGDRVRVEGFERRSRSRGRGRGNSGNGNRADFVAERVVIISSNNGGTNGGYGDGYDYGNNGGGYGTARRVSFPGTVLDRDGSRNLRVRGDNGRTYTVTSRDDIARIDDGDRVRVEGTSRSGIVTNARVTLISNSDSPVYKGRTIEFLGRVSRVDLARREIIIRDDQTGRSFVFRPREPGDFRVGQRVRAYGTSTGSRLVLTRVVRL